MSKLPIISPKTILLIKNIHGIHMCALNYFKIVCVGGGGGLMT